MDSWSLIGQNQGTCPLYAKKAEDVNKQQMGMELSRLAQCWVGHMAFPNHRGSVVKKKVGKAEIHIG